MVAKKWGALRALEKWGIFGEACSLSVVQEAGDGQEVLGALGWQRGGGPW